MIEDFDNLIEKYLEHEQWGMNNADQFHQLTKPPMKYFEVLYEALNSSDKWTVYQSAMLLASWGDDKGIAWILSDLAEINPEIDDPDDYDEISQYVLNYEKSDGTVDFALEAYRRLLAIAGTNYYIMSQHLPVSLAQSVVACHLADELSTTIAKCLINGSSDTATELLPVLASIQKEDCLVFLKRIFADRETIFSAENTPDAVTIGIAISELRQFDAVQWINKLSKTHDALAIEVSQVLYTKNLRRTIDQQCDWWLTRWQNPLTAVANATALYAYENSKWITSLASLLWGKYSLDLPCLRRAIDLKLATLKPEFDFEIFSTELGKYDFNKFSLFEKFVSSLFLSVMGKDDGIAALSDILDLLSTDHNETLMQNPVYGHDDAYDEIASAVFLYAKRTSDWTGFRDMATKLLRIFPSLPASIKIPAAVLDSNLIDLLPAIEMAYSAANKMKSHYHASKLLPALAKYKSSQWTPAIRDIKITEQKEEIIDDPAIFAVESLFYANNEEYNKILSELDAHENMWVSILAKEKHYISTLLSR